MWNIMGGKAKHQGMCKYGEKRIKGRDNMNEEGMRSHMEAYYHNPTSRKERIVKHVRWKKGEFWGLKLVGEEEWGVKELVVGLISTKGVWGNNENLLVSKPTSKDIFKIEFDNY